MSRHICWAPPSPSCSRLHDFSKWHRETFFANWIGLTRFQSRTFFKFGNSRGWYFKDYFSNKLILSQKWTNICLSSLYNKSKLSWRGENVNLTPLTSANCSVRPSKFPIGSICSIFSCIDTIWELEKAYSVDSIKRTVHLTFHGLFFLLKILFFWKIENSIFNRDCTKNISALKISNVQNSW